MGSSCQTCDGVSSRIMGFMDADWKIAAGGFFRKMRSHDYDASGHSRRISDLPRRRGSREAIRICSLPYPNPTVAGDKPFLFWGRSETKHEKWNCSIIVTLISGEL